ncbi:MAG: leucine-rich repeat domain-containing protein [Verrucomicrobiota bacterium]|jgi:Leucine-rich repeat (LRR) protein|nr:leucine-rich repeat domain-containing protein [Verrucomicrobiota bacterium]
MKQLLLIFAVVALVGCGPTISDPIVEKAIREELKKPTGVLTQADLEKVTELSLRDNQLTDVKGLEKLTRLTGCNVISIFG